MKAVQIERIIPVLKREISKYHMPIVSEIALRKDPYRVLISCLLSLRTKDETTAGASKRLFAKAKNPKQLAAMPIKHIEKLIYPVGFYKTKARRLKDIAKILVEKYSSRVPTRSINPYIDSSMRGHLNTTFCQVNIRIPVTAIY